MSFHPIFGQSTILSEKLSQHPLLSPAALQSGPQGGVGVKESIQQPKAQDYSNSSITFLKHHGGMHNLNQYFLKSTFPFPSAFFILPEVPPTCFLQHPKKFHPSPKWRASCPFPSPFLLNSISQSCLSKLAENWQSLTS